MALKFLTCTIRSSHPDFADLIMELWYEFEKGETDVAVLVRQIDKLDSIVQAVIYEERTGKDMSEFMELKDEITLPELRPLLDTCLEEREELRLRRQAEADLIVVFVSGISHQPLHNFG